MKDDPTRVTATSARREPGAISPRTAILFVMVFGGFAVALLGGAALGLLRTL